LRLQPARRESAIIGLGIVPDELEIEHACYRPRKARPL
jgi:hypothetical protein